MSDQAIEQKIQAKGLTAPRIKPSDIEANIVDTEIVKHVSKTGQVLRWAILTTRNGFAVVGKPSCSVSSANDNAEIGEEVAIGNSKDELWPLMGYELRSAIHAAEEACRMNRYLGVKQINAKAMTREEYNELRGWTVPADENPDDEGYLVEYVDGGKPCHPDFAGYISWSPKDVFERAYRPTIGMTFGLAVEAMKQGAKVARAGWNGAGMFAYYVPENSYPAQTGVAKQHFGDGALVPYRAYLALKTAQGDVATWAPSCSDALAEDWLIVE